MGVTLASVIGRRDEAAFVGRESELLAFDELFVDEPAVSVVHLHGPGGIGKSALVRAVARAGERRGWRPFFVDGRDLPPVPDALEAALHDVREEERPLLVFDTYERLGALDAYLRGSLLGDLAARAVVIIAGRRPPTAGWMQDGWETVVRSVALRPLGDDDARALLAARGVSDPDAADSIARWAAGSPLALTVGAQAHSEGVEGGDLSGLAEPERIGAMVRRLVDEEVPPAHRALLELVSIPRVTTPALLADVLGEEAAREIDWIASLSFAEPLGDGLTLHDLVRRGIRAELRAHAPERERDLRRRVCDHLHARAVEGRPLLTVDLAELVDNELIRSFYSWEGSGRYRIDGLRPGDTEIVEALMVARYGTAWWEPTRRFFLEAPESVALTRDADDAIVGMVIAVTPATAPDFAWEDPLLGPWLADARERVPDGNVVLWRDSNDFAHDGIEAPNSPIQAMLNMTGVLRSGLANPRYTYLAMDEEYASALSFSDLLGGEHLEHLDIAQGTRPSLCQFVDYGPGGILGKQRDVVYAELGLAPPDEPEPAQGPAAPLVGADDVRAALRSFALSGELARSPLARGRGVEDRAESVRQRLRTAAEGAFGDSAAEQQLREVLVRGYLDPAPSHELAADALNVSRSAYFRRLRTAVDRVAEYVAADA